MKRKRRVSIFLLYICPLLLTVCDFGIGFSSWLILQNTIYPINQDINVNVANVEIADPALIIKSVSSPEYHLEDNHVFLRTNTYNIDVFNVNDSCTFSVIYKFRVDNNSYNYSYNNTRYIKFKSTVFITNINQNLSNVFGLPHQSGNDICVKVVVTNDQSNWGWWQASSFTNSFSGNRQAILLKDYKLIKNFTPDAPFSDFQLEYTFKHEMYKIVLANPNMIFNMKAELSSS